MLKSELIEAWADRLVKFDYWTDYSDDYSVYKRGQELSKLLSGDIKAANFMTEDKTAIIKKAGEMYATFSDKDWDESQLKKMIASYLHLNINTGD